MKYISYEGCLPTLTSDISFSLNIIDHCELCNLVKNGRDFDEVSNCNQRPLIELEEKAGDYSDY